MAGNKWMSAGPSDKPHKWLLLETGKEPRWLEDNEVVEVVVPDVKIPAEVPMPYKWKPTFHGSLIPKKEEPTKPPEPAYTKSYEALDIEAYEMSISKIIEANSVKDFKGTVETVVQTATSKTKTKVKKNVAKVAKKKPAPAIFQWTFQSSQDVGGQKAVYSTLLRSNGDLTCNCPGWIFKRGTDRFCKHTKMVEAEGKTLYKDHKAGKELPAMELVGAGNINVAANPKKEGDLKYGRRIILD